MTGEGQSIAVVGAGSWGPTIAHTLAGRAAVSLWARDPALAAELLARRTNHRYLPGAELDPRVGVFDDLATAVAGAAVVLVAVPTVGLRAVVAAMAPALGDGVPVVSLAKGFEPGTRLRM